MKRITATTSKGNNTKDEERRRMNVQQRQEATPRLLALRGQKARSPVGAGGALLERQHSYLCCRARGAARPNQPRQHTMYHGNVYQDHVT